MFCMQTIERKAKKSAQMVRMVSASADLPLFGISRKSRDIRLHGTNPPAYVQLCRLPSLSSGLRHLQCLLK